MNEGISETKIEWFKAQNFEITLFPDERVKKFRDPSELELFLAQELEFWKGFTKALDKIRQAQQTYTEAIKTNDNAQDVWQRHFQNLFHQLKTNEQELSQKSSYWCYSKTKLGKKLRSIVDAFDDRTGQTFLDRYFQRDLNQNNYYNFIAAIEAYLFKEEAKAHRARFTRENREFHELHSDIDAVYEESINNELGRASAFDKIIVQHKSLVKEASVIFEAKQLELSDKIQDLLERFKSVNSRNLKSFELKNDSWHEAKEKRLQELENIYEEKLRLAEPVKYWEESAKKHRCNGLLFLLVTTLFGCFLMQLLLCILYGWPPLWMESNQWDLNTIKGSLVLLTMTSLGIYVIHILAKFCISSFHLSRDAFERQQLTYVYLSLVNENKIDPSEQKIVLQSLFSRVDTGLLKGEHAPTMPFVDSIIPKN